MRYPVNRFEVRPTPAEIRKVVEYHETFQNEYCKVWLADGSKKVFKNDVPVVHYYSGDNKS